MKRLATLGLVVLTTFALMAQAPKPKGTSGKLGDAATLESIERSWADLVSKKDVAGLDRLYADDLTDVGPDGKMQTKAQDLDDVKSGNFVVESENITDLKPRVYGNFAVVTGEGDLKGMYKGQDVSGRYRWTDTFMKRNGEWRLIASQATKVIEQQ